VASLALEDALSWLREDDDSGAASTAADDAGDGGVGASKAASTASAADVLPPHADAPPPAEACIASATSAVAQVSLTSTQAPPQPAPAPAPGPAPTGAAPSASKAPVRTARVALYDATNSTRARRAMIMDRCDEAGVPVMFVEIVCESEELVMANIREVKVSSPDYVGVEPNAAVVDFMSRIKHYEEYYETLSGDERAPPKTPISFVKLVNVSDHVVVHHAKGYVQSRIVYFLMNLNITPPCIYLSRHGESSFNVAGRIGGDADLSERGWAYARSLPKVVADHLAPGARLSVWTSTLRRTIQTAQWLPYPQLQWKALDELDSGVCDGLTYAEIEQRFPDDYAARDDDKYNYRYRGGESYADLVRRLEPVTLELERHYEPNHAILIIGHQAVIRSLYAYFMNYSHDELPYLNIPLHTVLKLQPKAYGCAEE
ncbi:Fructose-2,6-bisphosphatase, partial [Cladochytrium tenue]